MILFIQSDAIMLMQYFNKYAMNFQEILQYSSRIPQIPVGELIPGFPGLLDTPP